MSYYYVDGNNRVNFTIDDATIEDNSGTSEVQLHNFDDVNTANANADIYNGNIRYELQPDYSVGVRVGGLWNNYQDYNELLLRLKDFYQWMKDEQHGLEQECGTDLGGIIDKLEEIFGELNDKELLDIDL